MRVTLDTGHLYEQSEENNIATDVLRKSAALVIGLHAVLWVSAAHAGLWYGPQERRYGNLDNCLTQFRRPTQLDGLQRCADISRHAAEALLTAPNDPLMVGDLVFVRANAIGKCAKKDIKIPRRAMGRVGSISSSRVIVTLAHPTGLCDGSVVVDLTVLDKIDLMVTYGMHTLHQVMLEHRDPHPKDDRTLLHRVAYAEGNLVLGIHQANLDRPVVLFSICPGTPPTYSRSSMTRIGDEYEEEMVEVKVGKCSDIPHNGGIAASWLTRMTDEEAGSWIGTLGPGPQQHRGKVVIVYFEKPAAAADINGLVQAATLPVGYEGASFGPTAMLLRKQFFSFWDIPGYGTALPQGVRTTPGEFIGMVEKQFKTYKIGHEAPLDTSMPAHECLPRMLEVTNALNPDGARNTYNGDPSVLEPPAMPVAGVTGLYSVAGADTIKRFITDAKQHADGMSPGPACLAKYYIDSWNLADSYQNDMALQLMKEYLKAIAWRP